MPSERQPWTGGNDTKQQRAGSDLGIKVASPLVQDCVRKKGPWAVVKSYPPACSQAYGSSPVDGGIFWEMPVERDKVCGKFKKLPSRRSSRQV